MGLGLDIGCASKRHGRGRLSDILFRTKTVSKLKLRKLSLFDLLMAKISVILLYNLYRKHLLGPFEKSQTGWWLYPGDRCVQIFELNEENEHERMYTHFLLLRALLPH